MLREPLGKYRDPPQVGLADRAWPARRLMRAPIWLSTDLRDGNQALFEPMCVERKLQFFRLLCDIGFKQIEVGFPSASLTEFDFLRRLITGGLVPHDVTIAVLTQARAALIERTIEAVVGARRVIVHVYNATSALFRERVFGLSESQLIDLAVGSVAHVRELTRALTETRWTLQYSPETFNATELTFAKRICDEVSAAWGATPVDPIIVNLPATVEIATPNVYADQIEWMHRHLQRRDSLVLSAHPHNDRGCAVAAAELAQLAGAERIEGCLFGGGERTGNVDLVTLALNLYAHGIDPGLDFSHLDEVARAVERYTGLPIHPRHPYAGDLVFTAFAGSHQDAIRKGLATQAAGAAWQVPYLPIDPRDVGRGYEAVIRINSQSGKGGVAYLLEHEHGLTLPRRLLIELGGIVQRHADALGTELSAAQLWEIFEGEYLIRGTHLSLLGHRLEERAARNGEPACTAMELRLQLGDTPALLRGAGNGPLDALMNAMPLPLTLLAYEERALGAGADARALALVELKLAEARPRFGAGVDTHIVTACIRAAIGALDRILAEADAEERSRALGHLRAASTTR